MKAYRVLMEKLEGTNKEEVGVAMMIILKWILRK
jgi:hypothetical protein